MSFSMLPVFLLPLNTRVKGNPGPLYAARQALKQFRCGLCSAPLLLCSADAAPGDVHMGSDLSLLLAVWVPGLGLMSVTTLGSF